MHRPHLRSALRERKGRSFLENPTVLVFRGYLSTSGPNSYPQPSTPAISLGTSGNALQISGRRGYIRQRIPLASNAGHPRQHLPHLLHLPIFLAPHSATTPLRRYQKNLLRTHPSIIANPLKNPVEAPGALSPSSSDSIPLISPSLHPPFITRSIRRSRLTVKNMTGRGIARRGKISERRYPVSYGGSAACRDSFDQRGVPSLRERPSGKPHRRFVNFL